MITGHGPISFAAAFLVAGLLIASNPAAAKEYPPTPLNPTVTPSRDTPGALAINWSLPHCPPDQGHFEIEETVNGVRLTPIQETSLSASRGSLIGTAECSHGYGFVLGSLDRETEYCFRIWTRVNSTGVRSLFPSVWACGRLPPNPPLAPLDVRAVVASRLGDGPPHVTWSTPDQSGHRGIATYVVERQSPPGAGRPWILEREVAGPAGAQMASTRLAFSIVGSAVNLGAKHAYRVCSVNEGGRTCASQVELATLPDAFGSNAAQSSAPVVLPSKPSPAAQARIEPGPNRPPTDSGQRAATTTSPQAATPAAALASSQPDRYARPLEILVPAPGSSHTQGNVRVQVQPPTGATAAQIAEVELSWLPPRTDKPGDAAAPAPAVKVKTWQVPLDRLTQGVVMPRDVTDAWIGPTLVRVRMANAGAWSKGISFDLVSLAGRQAATPATSPNWTVATPAPAAPAARMQQFGTMSRVTPTGAAAATGAPASSLQPRP